MINLLVQFEPGNVVRQLVDELEEAVHRSFGLGTQRACRYTMRRGLPQRCRRGLGLVADHVQRLGADAARRQVHHALERGIVGAAGNQAQIRQRVLDFGALEEAQAAVHAIRNARRHEDFFEHPGLGVRAVQDGHVAPRATLVHPFADAVHDELGLVALVERGVQPDAFAVAARGPQVLAEAPGVVGDQRVRGLEDVAGGAVVLLQAVHLRGRVVARETREVLHARTAPAVDGLVVVTHHEGRAILAGDQQRPGVLDGVGVLELVDQHVPEALLVVLAGSRGFFSHSS